MPRLDTQQRLEALEKEAIEEEDNKEEEEAEEDKEEGSRRLCLWLKSILSGVIG